MEEICSSSAEEDEFPEREELLRRESRNSDMNGTQKADPEEVEDVVSRAIGNFGRWQLKLTFLLSLFNIPCTFHIYSPTFLANPKEFWCARPSQFKDVDVQTWIEHTQPDKEDACRVYDFRNALNLSDISSKVIECSDWEFEKGGETIIEEFLLVCDRKFLNNVSEMMFLAGVAIGGFVCGFFSDKFGRKRTLMVSVLLQTLLGISIAFVPTFWAFCALRALLGFISVSVVFSGFVLVIELVGGRWRTVSGLAYIFPLSVGYAIVAGIAWLVPDWRRLQMAISFPGALFCLAYWALPESPRWLLALGRTAEVRRILEKAIECNGKTVPDNLEKMVLEEGSKAGGEEAKVSVWDLFRTWKMCKVTLLLSVIWFVVYLIYYGLTLNMKNIGGDIYVNTVISGLVEIPAIAVSILILLKTGRRYPFSSSIFFSGVFALFIIPVKVLEPDLQWPVTVLAMIGKLLISASNAIMPVFTAELYPTTMRNLGVGASNVSAGIALMLVPYIYETEVLHVSIPLIILGVFGVVGGISVLFLPETGNKPLIDTLEKRQN